MPADADWSLDHRAVWKELEPGTNRAITLRHPTYPYVGEWATEDPDDLRKIAGQYLDKVKDAFGLPENLLVPRTWVFRAPRPNDVALAWRPLPPDPDARRIPDGRDSFWVNRYGDPSTPSRPLDRTAVFLAVQSAVANQASNALGSRHGIRIVAHVSVGDRGRRKIRITGATCSTGFAKAMGLGTGGLSAFFEKFFADDDFRNALKGMILKAAGISPAGSPWIDGLRILRVTANDAHLEVYVNVQRPADLPLALAYALTARVSIDFDQQAARLAVQSVERFPLVAHAGAPVKARLFPQDPPSQTGEVVAGRPSRSPQALERFRALIPLPGLAPQPNGDVDLVDQQFAQVTVTRSKLVEKSANENNPETVRPATVQHARTNPFAALSSYQHARELFDSMRAYGLSPTAYFKFAALPLLARYRATINPGPGKDGKTVNAMVDYDPPGSDIGGAWGGLEPLQVRFALADLKRSSSRREPLGLAADPRWSWHEYGHVLLAASTGALEFLFAHSAGDALAAVVWDPISKLADRPPLLRWATFPWVYLNRRHDRSVWHGWSWSGTYHRPARFPSVSNRRRKGYQSEQILSTSLFRLYRALGGDTARGNGQPDEAARRAAADYVVYLIMRALALLGPASAVPAQTPDQLVSALIDADIGTGPAGGGAQGPLAQRVGGWAHKVARWAFEAQGLYATTNPSVIIDAPGNPPDVDVFIDNRRPDADGAHPRGGYMPVSLDWHASPAPSAWHASASALQIVNNQVTVEVRNRGHVNATGVTVAVWYTVWPPGQQQPPKWDQNQWTALPPGAPQTVPVGGIAAFGPFAGLPTQKARYLVLAAATCPADLANTDPTTGLPCSSAPTPIMDLVAGDNNLGLRLYVIP